MRAEVKLFGKVVRDLVQHLDRSVMFPNIFKVVKSPS